MNYLLTTEDLARMVVVVNNVVSQSINWSSTDRPTHQPINYTSVERIYNVSNVSCQWRQREFKVGGTKCRGGKVWRGVFPSHRGKGLARGNFLFCDLKMAYHILANSEVLNLNFFFIVSSLGGFGSILQQILDFRAKQWIKDIIKKCCSWARTTNISLLYLKVRNNLWDIPIDVPQPEYWRGCVPGIPAGLTPVLTINSYLHNKYVFNCCLKPSRKLWCLFKKFSTDDILNVGTIITDLLLHHLKTSRTELHCFHFLTTITLACSRRRLSYRLVPDHLTENITQHTQLCLTGIYVDHQTITYNNNYYYTTIYKAP